MGAANNYLFDKCWHSNYFKGQFTKKLKLCHLLFNCSKPYFLTLSHYSFIILPCNELLTQEPLRQDQWLSELIKSVQTVNKSFRSVLEMDELTKKKSHSKDHHYSWEVVAKSVMDASDCKFELEHHTSQMDHSMTPLWCFCKFFKA